MFQTRKERGLIELIKHSKLESYQTKPETWLTERLGVDDKLLYWDKHPGYENHKWDGTKNPFAVAFNALANGRWVGIESGTGVGKTFVLARIVAWYLDVFPNSLVITTGPKLEQLKRVLWKEIGRMFNKRFKKIRPHAELYSLNLRVDDRTHKLKIEDSEDSETGHEAIGIVAGVGAGEESAGKMRGFHAEYMLFIIDELTAIHQSILNAIVNTCADPIRNLICGVGNPTSISDALHILCQLRHTEAIRISAYDHPNVVNNRRIIPGAVTNESIELRKEQFGESSPLFIAMTRGIAPAQASGALIKAASVDQCTEGDETFDVEYREKDFYNSVGVDVANSEQGDMAAVAFGKGNKMDYLKEFHCPNANHLAYNLVYDAWELSQNDYTDYGIPTIKDYEIDSVNIGIDGVGVGVATVNSLIDLDFTPTSLIGGQLEEVMAKDPESGELMTKFASLRAQMWWELKEDLRTKQVIISIDDKRILRDLKKELIAPLDISKRGMIRIEAKEDVKKRTGGKSPNMADALVYWNWVRKGYYNQNLFLPFV